MKRKKILVFLLVVGSVVNIFLFLSLNVKAAYDLDVDEDDTFEWEVTEVNNHQFEKVFNFKPNFEEGDRCKRTIERIDDTAEGWTLVIEFWDWKIEQSDNGSIVYVDVPDSAGDYDEDLFIPTPVNDYLSNAAEDLGSEYTVRGNTVERIEKDYRMVKEYDGKGVLVLEEYTDDDGIVLVRVEGLFRIIPGANIEVILGVLALAIIGIIIVMVKRKMFRIKIT